MLFPIRNVQSIKIHKHMDRYTRKDKEIKVDCIYSDFFHYDTNIRIALTPKCRYLLDIYCNEENVRMLSQMLQHGS